MDKSQHVAFPKLNGPLAVIMRHLIGKADRGDHDSRHHGSLKYINTYDPPQNGCFVEVLKSHILLPFLRCMYSV